jgi:hypothetical protein
VLEPFAEDFQEQAFDESWFFFAEQQGKCPLTIFAPISLTSILLGPSVAQTFARPTRIDCLSLRNPIE